MSASKPDWGKRGGMPDGMRNALRDAVRRAMPDRCPPPLPMTEIPISSVTPDIRATRSGFLSMVVLLAAVCPDEMRYDPAIAS